MRYNLVHKLLFVDSNMRSIYYFPYAPLLDTIIKGNSKYGVRFMVINDVQKPADLRQRFDYFWGAEGAKVIYYEHPIAFGIKAKMLLDMSGKFPAVTVNRAYYSLVKYRFENVWPPGQHLMNVVAITLLQNNMVTLHGAAFSDKKTQEGYLVFGASNTGKSYTTFRTLERGYQYHSEDLIILDKDYIYTTPLISAQSSMLPNKNGFLKFNLFINKLTGLNMFIPRIHTLSSFRSFINAYDVTYKTKVKKIFVLENGDESMRRLTSTETLRKLLILNNLELSYSRDHVLLAYSYFNPTFDMENMHRKEMNMVQHITEKSECFLVKSPTPDRYFDLIHQAARC